MAEVTFILHSLWDMAGFSFLLFLARFSFAAVRRHSPFCHPRSQWMYSIVLCLVYFFACARCFVFHSISVLNWSYDTKLCNPHTPYATQCYRPRLGTVSAGGVVQYVLCTVFFVLSLLKNRHKFSFVHDFQKRNHSVEKHTSHQPLISVDILCNDISVFHTVKWFAV